MSLATTVVQALSQLRDVLLTSPTNGQALVYDSNAGKWKNGTAGASSPLTTKGDLWAYGPANTRRPVGTDGYALVADSTQVTGLNYAAIGTAQPNTKVQLDYAESTDIANGSTLTANAWNDVGTNQTFTVDDVNSVIEISVSGNVLANSQVASRIIIDSAGTPITKYIGGSGSNNPNFANILAGSTVVSITGLATGSHTVKLQANPGTNTGIVIYCQPASNVTYSLSIRVLERKQSTAPSPPTVWSTKTGSYTILTTDRAILVDTSSGPITITLPTAISATQVYTIKKKTPDTNAVTVATTSSQTVDGSTTYILPTQYQSIDVASDNTNWFIL